MPTVASKLNASSLLVAGLATLAVGLVIRKAVNRLTTSRQQDVFPDCFVDKARNILLVLTDSDSHFASLDLKSLGELAREFCGTVVTDLALLPSLVDKTVYLCGDIARATSLELGNAKQVYIIQELSSNYDSDRNATYSVVDLGRVPILVHGVGVHYRRFFDSGLDCFNWIQAEHAFQTLTESTKPGTAHRTGIYLTPVEQHGEEFHFRLLRCSSNFSGPTVDFGSSDKHIVQALNQEASCIFQNQAPLNHVLAQVYHNSPAVGKQKQTKAKIKAHADKTKDMPGNGLMAFCTFYDKLDRLKPMVGDVFDYGHKGVSGLTKLHFRLKPGVAEQSECTLKKQFSVTLYPNSVFFMPLSTNRLYTHEIRPAGLDAHMLPTRMGYVVRCSGTEALHKDGQTFLKTIGGKLVELEAPTLEGLKRLRTLYAEENSSDAVIDYAKHGPLPFSMNDGDYLKPQLGHIKQEFRTLSLQPADTSSAHSEVNLFEELLVSAQFEDVGKGRQGTVLVKLDGARGVPIVRTTTKYRAAAHCFQAVHMRLARQIQQAASLPVEFNNALIETYTNSYTTMGFHSDQDLDLEDGSVIAVFSCYKHPELPPRKLVIESKQPGGGTCAIPLAHNSVVLFTCDTNRRFRHKIVLDAAAHPAENQWLGVTFRTSKTFVKFTNGQACFQNAVPLSLADDDQRREFFKLRSQENASMDFAYPPVTYTISESDLMPPR